MNKKKPSRNYEEINKEGIELFANSQKEDCPQCKDLPEGEVVKGHDHRPNKPNSNKDNQATSESWEEEFLDKFSVMLERAGREEGESSGDWEIYCLDFIRELLQSQKDRLKGKIETLYHHGDVRTKLILKEVIKLLE
jgi:hypothetical protein